MESNKDNITEDIPKAEENDSEIPLNVDVELNQTPPVSELNFNPDEILNNDFEQEFLAQIRSWSRSDQEHKELNTTKCFTLADISDMIKICQCCTNQEKNSRLTKLNWQKRKIELRHRRERVLINIRRLSKLSSKLSSNSKCICNQTTLSDAIFQDITDLFAQYRAEKKLNTRRCKNHKSCCPMFQSNSKTGSQSSGYSADESSFDDLTDLEDLDVSLTNVWNEWNMPSPSNIDITDMYSVENLI